MSASGTVGLACVGCERTAGTPLLQRALEAPPVWAQQELQACVDNRFRRWQESFVTRHYWTDTGSVNVYRVIGTAHPEYQRRSWQHLLEHGRRMHLNLGLHAGQPVYYHKVAPRHPAMHFRTLNGLDFFIGHDGNHRTCIARYHFEQQGEGVTHLHGVTIEHFEVDQIAADAYHRLVVEVQTRNLPLFVNAERTAVGREDTAGWKLDHYEPVVTVTHGPSGRVERLCGCEPIQAYLDGLPASAPPGLLARLRTQFWGPS